MLRKQLGAFRIQVDAPSRTKAKNRPTEADLHFVKVNDEAQVIRDLGKRRYPIAELPLTLVATTIDAQLADGVDSSEVC